LEGIHNIVNFEVMRLVSLSRITITIVAFAWTVTSICSFGMITPSRFSNVGKRFYSKRSALLASVSSVPSVPKSDYDRTKQMPITILSGFLGAGKTSFLQNVLESQNGVKFGLVVNDMGAVNVDAKQIKQQTIGTGIDGIDTLELQNGCVCCNLAEDLISSVSQLVAIADRKEANYDHVIVECSGIAEPRKIRDLFQEAEDFNYPLLRRLKLDTMITLVDAVVFLDMFGTDKDINSNSELCFKVDDIEGRQMLDDGSGMRKVTELLLEQVECADIVLINKTDLLKNAFELELVKKIISSVNPTAKIITCVRGDIEDPLEAVGSAKGDGAASWGVLYEHKKLVELAEESDKKEQEALKAAAHDEATCTDPTHDHSHSSSNHAAVADHDETTCTDPTHDHSHSSDHDEATCIDPTHDHSHLSSNHAVADHDEATCTDPTHDHSHSSSNHAVADHDEETCTDPTHDHSHFKTQQQDSPSTTADERFGINSFVYKRRTPFHPGRFSLFLQGLGKLSVKGISEIASTEEKRVSVGEAEGLTMAKKALLRSKGFVWMGTSKTAAYFISHAGQYLELMVLGRWWADIPSADWPKGSEDEITVDFDGHNGKQ